MFGLSIQPANSSPNHETSRRTSVCCQFLILFHSLITHLTISMSYTQQNKNEWISSTIQKIMDPSSNTLATEIHHLTFMISSLKYILLHSVHYLRTTILVLITSTTTVLHHLRTVHIVPCAREQKYNLTNRTIHGIQIILIQSSPLRTSSLRSTVCCQFSILFLILCTITSILSLLT